MAKKGGSAPSAPDPSELAREQAQANRVDVYSPWGTALYSGEDRNQLTVTPNQNQMGLIGLQENVGLGLGQRALQEVNRFPSQPLGFEGLPQWASGIDMQGLSAMPGAGAQDMGDYQNAIYENQLQFVRPEFERQRERMTQDLANRGIPVGSEGHSNALDQFGERETQAYNQAANQATMAGVDLGFRTRGTQLAEALQNSQMTNAARQQGINERLMERQNRFNELSTMLGGQQIHMPQSAAPVPVDVAGPAMGAYQGQLAAWQQGQQNQQSTMGGLLGLGGALGAAAIMSDRNLKADDGPAERILDRVKTLAVRTWRYQWEPEGTLHIGPYAQDWAERFGGDGRIIPTVDAIGVCLQSIKDLAQQVDRLEARA